MSRTKIVLFLLGFVVAVLAGTATAHAQDATVAASDLRENDVTFEEGVPGLSSNDIDRLDNLTAQLSVARPYFKVILLAEPVTAFDSPREFAQVVQQRLGGSGRVVVFDTDRTGIASTLDSDEEISRAEDAANRQQSEVAQVEAAAAVLGVTTGDAGAGTGGGSGDDGGGRGSAAIWIVVGLGVVAVLGFVLWRLFKKSGARGAESTVSLGEGEMKVRQHVDRAGNLVLELADRVEQPGAPPEAKQLFQDGAAEFADLQDDLEAADTRPELEAVYPRIGDAAWKLESAKALLDGAPAPPAPSGEPLFPPPPAPPAVPAGRPLGAVDLAPAPEPHYRGFSASPWLTTAATAALTMLASRAMSPQRSYRPPADDGFFLSGGGGGGGRGMGRRRGGAGGSSGRGMGRRR